LELLAASGQFRFNEACNVQISNDELVNIGYPNLPCTATANCIVSVGATDPDGDRWSEGSADPAAKVKGSNFGAQTVDIGMYHCIPLDISDL
jgi:hypothetical protein